MARLKRLTACLISLSILAGMLPAAALQAAATPAAEAYQYNWVTEAESFQNGTFLIGSHRNGGGSTEFLLDGDESWCENYTQYFQFCYSYLLTSAVVLLPPLLAFPRV